MLEFHYRDADEGNRATDALASVLDDGLKPGHLEAFPGVIYRFLIGIGADQHVVILIPLRRLHKSWKIFLAQRIRKRHRIRFSRERSNLQTGASARAHRRDADGLRNRA